MRAWCFALQQLHGYVQDGDQITFSGRSVVVMPIPIWGIHPSPFDIWKELYRRFEITENKSHHLLVIFDTYAEGKFAHINVSMEYLLVVQRFNCFRLKSKICNFPEMNSSLRALLRTMNNSTIETTLYGRPCASIFKHLLCTSLRFSSDSSVR